MQGSFWMSDRWNFMYIFAGDLEMLRRHANPQVRSGESWRGTWEMRPICDENTIQV